jgi:hypothetical protein
MLPLKETVEIIKNCHSKGRFYYATKKQIFCREEAKNSRKIPIGGIFELMKFFTKA